MKTKKYVALLLAVIMMVSLFTGCGGKGGNGTEQAGNTAANSTANNAAGSANNGETKEIAFWHSFTQPERQAVMEQLAKDFESKNPGVKINIEVYPWATFHTKWTTGLATQAVPDISTSLVDEAMLMAKANALLPMDDVLDTLGRDRFYEKPLKLLSYDGKVIALPYYAHARVLWYRKDLLEAKGLKAPKTWDEFLKVAAAVTDAPKTYGFVIPFSKKDYIATSFLYIVSESMGSHILTGDGKANLTDPNMIKAISYLVELHKKACPPGALSYGGKEELDLFYQGKTAFDISTGFNIDGIIKTSPALADKIAAVPTPVPNENDVPKSAFADYISMVRWNNSKYPDVTKKFLEFMYEKENYIKFLHLVPGGMLPTLKDIGESEEFFNNETIQKYKDDVKVIQQGIEVGSPIGGDMANSPSINVIKNQGIIEEMFHRIIVEKVPVEKAAKETEDRLNKAIAELK